jgi:hypothetical protein
MNELTALTDPFPPSGAPEDPEDWRVEMRKVRDPNGVGFPAMLPMELAMKVDTPKAICAAYGVDRDTFAAFLANPLFLKAYAEAVEALKINGMSFKLKAQMAAEEYLKTAFQMVKNTNVSDAVRADLIKSTVRWAGWDAKAAEVAGGGQTFSINIDLRGS